MLQDWVLEHAGDAGSANKSTDQAQWENAQKAIGMGLKSHPEIFAFQTRGHWTEVGLPGAGFAEDLIAKVNEEKSHAQADERAHDVDAGAKPPPEVAGAAPEAAADAVMKKWDGYTYVFTNSDNSEQLINLINREYRWGIFSLT